MNEPEQAPLEQRARALFHGSVENLDMRVRSRLTQARYAALESAAARKRWLPRKAWWTPAAGVTAAAVLGVALWMGSPLHHQAATLADAQSNFEDLDLLAASDEGSPDALEMLQDDIDFYDFADKSANPGPAA